MSISADIRESGRPNARKPVGIGHAAARLAAACLLLAGCGDASAPGTSAGTVASPHSSPRATVSLSPAITATLVDLGVGEAVVGRTPWCWAVPESVPAVGSLLEIDYERLIEAKPSAVLVQPGVGGVDPELERIARERGWTLAAWRLERLADVEAMLEDLRSIPPVAGDASAIARLERRLGEIEALRAAPIVAAAPRVLLLVSADPPTAAAADTFLDELVAAAGGRNALDGRRGYVGLSLEEIAALAPEITILLRDEPADRDRAPPESLVEATRGRVRVVACREAFMPSSLAPLAAVAIGEAISPAREGGPP